VPAYQNHPLEKKGIIHNVPLSESEEDLLDSLLLQGAIKVERFHRSIDGSTTVPTGTVCITFDSPPPSRVTIVALSFTVSTYYPSPYKCSKCWKLGHTKNHCTSSDIKCRKCGDSHDETMLCSQKCVNCSSPDHLSDSKTCPAFLDLSALIKFSIDNEISIKEARSQIGKTYSAVTSRHPTSPTPMEIPQGELTRLKTDIRNLQEELTALKRDTITYIEEKVNKISADTDSTNKRLDKLEESITARFDQLVNHITSRLPPNSRPSSGPSRRRHGVYLSQHKTHSTARIPNLNQKKLRFSNLLQNTHHCRLSQKDKNQQCLISPVSNGTHVD
jgi:hypothetical protein